MDLNDRLANNVGNTQPNSGNANQLAENFDLSSLRLSYETREKKNPKYTPLLPSRIHS